MAKAKTVTLGAVGDIAFAREISEEMERHGYDWPFEKMTETLKQADILFGNMESTTLPDNFPPEQVDPSGLIARVDGRKAAAALKRAGFDMLNMAANHVLDAGSAGMDFTRKCIEEAGIATGGIGWSQEEARTLKVIEKKGIRFGFLCYAEDSNWTLGQTRPGHAHYAPEAIIEDVRAHRKEVDILVVSIHADMEFMPTPSMPRIEVSRRIARAGANIILEHHPHVPQGIETVEGCLIVYSLGNFVFDAQTSEYFKRNSKHTGDSYVLLVNVDKTGVRGFKRVPAYIGAPPEQRPRRLEGTAGEKMLAYLDELDRNLQDEEFVKKTWRETARKRVWALVQRAAERNDVDNFVQDTLPRLAFVPENRSCFEEVLKEARELWEKKLSEPDKWHRPNFRFQKQS